LTPKHIIVQTSSSNP